VQIIRVIYNTNITCTKVKQYYDDILIRACRKFMKSSDIKKYAASCNDVQSRGFGSSHVIYAHAHRQSCHYVPLCLCRSGFLSRSLGRWRWYGGGGWTNSPCARGKQTIPASA